MNWRSAGPGPKPRLASQAAERRVEDDDDSHQGGQLEGLRAQAEHLPEDDGDEGQQGHLLEQLRVPDGGRHARSLGRQALGGHGPARFGIGVDGQRAVAWRELRAGQPPDHGDGRHGHDDRRDHDPGPRREGVQPGRPGRHAEDPLLHDVRGVQLGDVDPPLLRQLDDDPDEGRGSQQDPVAHAPRVPEEAHRLVEDEEVLERVGEDEEQPALAATARRGPPRRADRR